MTLRIKEILNPPDSVYNAYGYSRPASRERPGMHCLCSHVYKNLEEVVLNDTIAIVYDSSLSIAANDNLSFRK